MPLQLRVFNGDGIPMRLVFCRATMVVACMAAAGLELFFWQSASHLIRVGGNELWVTVVWRTLPYVAALVMILLPKQHGICFVFGCCALVVAMLGPASLLVALKQGHAAPLVLVAATFVQVTLIVLGFVVFLRYARSDDDRRENRDSQDST